MPFFIRNRNKANISADTKKKGKRPVTTKATESAPQKKRKPASDQDEIPSDSEIDSDEEAQEKQDYGSSSGEEDETAQEKRLRLAKQYLAQLETEEAEKLDDDDDEVSRDVIADRIKRDLLEQSGKLQREVAKEYDVPCSEDIRLLRGHQLTVTCVVLTPDNKHVFSASKDCSIIKWDLATGKKVHTIHGGRKGTEKKHKGHTAHILSLAISSDGQYLVSGDRNKLIHVWNPHTCELLHTFTGHRDAVTGLAFRKGSHQLFSASQDRMVKVWTLDEMAYVETLFGHQDGITAIDSLTRERAVTSGGMDNSVRVWKIVEESQLVFHGHAGSIDCVALINENNFVTGASDNSLALWSVMKKKPLVTVRDAHSGGSEGAAVAQKENWITSVASLQNTDLIASAGSKDGCIRLWQCSQDFKCLTRLFTVPVDGFVNSLQFSSDGSLLVAAVGQEHKLGRWWRIKQARNGIRIIKLRKKEPS